MWLETLMDVGFFFFFCLRDVVSLLALPQNNFIR